MAWGLPGSHSFYLEAEVQDLLWNVELSVVFHIENNMLLAS